MRTDTENPGLDRVRNQLRSTGVKNAVVRPQLSGLHSRGYLPHLKRENAKYFITFRLGDSLPKDVLLQHEAERALLLKALRESERSGNPPKDDQESINRAFRRQIER